MTQPPLDPAATPDDGNPTAGSGTRTVLITGAAGGLGRAFALGFASRGYRVAAADTNLAGAEKTAALVREAGADAEAFEADVTDVASTEALAQGCADFGQGSIDVVLNNAAIYATVTRTPFEEIDPAEWDLVMNVNLKGPWLVTRAASPYLPDGGRVINLSSATIYSGSEQWLHYVASKGGVVAMTRVLAKELGRRNITVNAIAPGFTLTEASYGLMENAENYGVDRGALKRASQPEDIVGAALFLAGPDSSYISGQTMVVDGGRQFI
ncbi:SDR family NAD(P)-dependent oxidoreductase [Arthrobacter sulfonylureivorans]|uniref:SDR family oxidoreductase n=1 Tax=Arthrobacter sulfonylureivorans TaxID=2486855 RepID=A0ABY3WAY5_9MICC|nr:SDR family oxidoreductase [Arthrobacter sulfonylureivorans]UNK45496.1 SDR family oxidoreductase [Arthrobacter sulfonylureivorans]